MSEVLLTIEDTIATITIDRPKALNALNGDVLQALQKVLHEVDDKAARFEVRAVIVRGGGEKAFVAGADIKAMQEMNVDQARGFAEMGQKAFRMLEILNVPVVAAVDGFALGGGLELALGCDFIFATKSAKFGLPEVSLGLIPGFGGTQRLARAIGVQKAREMIFSGLVIDSDEAKAWGLVNRVFDDPATLYAQAKETCLVMASRAPLAIRESKRAILQGTTLDIDSGLELERDLFSDLFGYSDVREGINAFIEKRPPKFQGH